MKIPLLILTCTIMCFCTKAQMHVSENVYAGDTTISTDFATLFTQTHNGKTEVTDRVVGVRTISKNKNTYWLFFYFRPFDIEASSIQISNGRYAYIQTAADKYYRIPYSGKTYTYQTDAKAGFFIDITNYADQLKNEEITAVRLETSVLYHDIKLSGENCRKIAEIVSALITRGDSSLASNRGIKQ